MKKPSIAALLAACVTVSLVAQEAPGTPAATGLNLGRYASYLGFQNGKVDFDSAANNKYLWPASDSDLLQYGGLAGTEIPDTPLEIALLSYYSPEIVRIRPQGAVDELPANSHASEIKLAAAVWQELQAVKFLDPQNRDRIGRYEGMLRFISQRHNITQAEINSAARASIAATVRDEFNKISFLLENTVIRKGYNAVLIRDTKNQYILSYENTNYETKTLSAPTLDALLDEMRRNGAEFDNTGIQAVREKADLIPAVVYAEWQTKGVARGTDALALVTETLANFYLNPSQNTYNAVLGIYARYHQLVTRAHDPFASAAGNSLRGVISALCPEMSNKISSDILRGNAAVLARVPDDARYNVFSTPGERRGD
jgi:hypothetical protein